MLTIAVSSFLSGLNEDLRCRESLCRIGIIAILYALGEYAASLFVAAADTLGGKYITIIVYVSNVVHIARTVFMSIYNHEMK